MDYVTPKLVHPTMHTPSSHVFVMAQYIRWKTFEGFKSHDYNVLMHQILPLALRGLLDHGPWMAIIRISKVFRRICNKVWNPFEIESLWLNILVSLALLEMYFPPLFFDIMTHLLYHLLDELDVCGLVATRWIYPIERYMKTLKLYVHNTTWLEASMAKVYIQNECLGFIIEYL
jgi:hypothetical protein